MLPGTGLAGLALLASGLRLSLTLATTRLILLLVARHTCASSSSAAPAAPTAAAAPASAPPSAPARDLGGRLTLRPGGHGNQAIEAAGTPPAGRLVWPALMLAHPVIPFNEPLLERPLDLWFRRSGFFGPDARPVGSDRIGCGIDIRRFRLYYPFRLEIGHRLEV